MFSEIDRGLTLKFSYPRHNFRGVRSARERRRVLIEEVRNLEYQPLETETIALQPLLARGTLLVTGIDLDKRERRSFYYEAMQDIEVTSGEDDRQKHRVYVLDPSGEVPPMLAFTTDRGGGVLGREEGERRGRFGMGGHAKSVSVVCH